MDSQQLGHQTEKWPEHSSQNQSEGSEVEEEEDKFQSTRNTEQLLITDPHQYLAYCTADKKIKIMDECNPIFSNIYLKDISLHKKGPLEDKIYSKNFKYYLNIRRGNTLCQIYKPTKNEDGELAMVESELFMCRRGMKKFYDLEPEYMKVNRKLTHQHQRYRNRIFEELDQVFEQNQQQQKEQKGGSKIHLYGLFKENGEHCQITHLRSQLKYQTEGKEEAQHLQFWLFASKNVAILARSQQDLEDYYNKERFYWAKLIGKEFFKILSTFSQEQVEEFKKDIQGKTLLGEHCGYEKHQHITKYEGIQIIFYGIVQNNGKQHCIPVRQCEAFLNKYRLRMSRMRSVENLTEKNRVYKSMFQMLKKVAEGTMDEEGEGTVMYIVQEDQEGKQKTIGMCKLKTSEYLIYRKMREMIKIYFARKGNTANSFDKYQFQIENLCENYFKPPKKLEFYYQIAEEAFKEVRKHQKQFSDDEFRYKFVSFLNKIRQTVEQRGEREVEAINSDPKLNKIIFVSLPLLSEESKQLQNFIKKGQYSVDYAYRATPVPVRGGQQLKKKKVFHLLHMVPRINAQNLKQLEKDGETTVILYVPTEKYLWKVAQQLETIKDLKKSHLISFIKSQNKAKSLELLNQKLKGFQKVCQDSEASCYHIVSNFEDAIEILKGNNKSKPQLSTKEKQRMDQNQHKKTEEQQDYQKQAQNLKLTYIIVPLLIPGAGKSTLAQYLEQQYPQKSLTVISSDKIRKNIMEKQKSKRKDDISIQQLYANTKKKGLEKYRQAINSAIEEREADIIFIDRVFCPTTIVQNFKEMNRPWVKFLILTQKPLKNTSLNDFYYPISMKFLLKCIKRSLEREQHETLSQKPTEVVRVLLKFYQMFRGYNYEAKLSRSLIKEQIKHEVINLELIEEDQQDPVNLHLKKKLQQILKFISPGNDAPENIQNKYNELIELMYKYPDYVDGLKNQNKKGVKKQKQIQDDDEGQTKDSLENVMKRCSLKIFDSIKQ